ncbi:hypothetical protein [Kutzneria sp. 744]|uniref:hypothetical protein n=1 Tax=Kutzneria sp. (strain 744) TaxID=345341 RepID=UPI0005B765BD|nr:hypothetical protein [Kutzneria sp. 744]
MRAARQGVSRLFDVLVQAFPDRAAEEVAKVFVRDDPAPADLQALLGQGNVGELVTAFSRAAFGDDSPLTLKALLSEAARRGDWSRPEQLGLSVATSRRSESLLADRGPDLDPGASRTAAKIGSAFRLLDVTDADPDGVALSVLGSMLPGGDHSLRAVLGGLRAADAVPSLATRLLDDAADMYRSVPGVRLEELRELVGADGMLPHEAVYWAKLRTLPEDGGFRELGTEGIDVADHRRQAFQRLVDERPSDDMTRAAAEWMRDNAITARQVLERLSPAHFAAVIAYTGPAFPLINVLLRFQSRGTRMALRFQVRRLLDMYLSGERPDHEVPLTLRKHEALRPVLDTVPKKLTFAEAARHVDEYLDDAAPQPLPPVLADKPGIHELAAIPHQGMTPEQLAEHRERFHAAAKAVLPAIDKEVDEKTAAIKEQLHAAVEPLLPAIEKEMAAHTAMLADALAIARRRVARCGVARGRWVISRRGSGG